MSFRYDGDDVKESDDKRRSVSLQDDTSQGRYCPVRPTLGRHGGSSYTEQDNDRQKIPLAGRDRACGTQLCTGSSAAGSAAGSAARAVGSASRRLGLFG